MNKIDKDLERAEQTLRSPGTYGQFNEYLDNQIYTICPSTKKKYLRVLAQFQKQDQSIIGFLREHKNLLYLGAIKKALLCIEERELSREDIFKTHAFPVHRQALTTTKAEREQIIEAITNPMYKLMAKIQHDTGCRAAEVVSLKITQIAETDDGRIKLHLKTKGSKTRDSFLSMRTSKELDTYLSNMRGAQEEVFWDKSELCFDSAYNYYWMAVRKASETVFGKDKLRSSRVGTHAFRFGVASDIYKKTRSILDVKVALGHASISTSAIYAAGAALSSLDFVKSERDKEEI